MVQRQRHENELSFVRNQTAKDACALRESSVDLMVERLVHTKLRAAQREVEKPLGPFGPACYNLSCLH